MHREDSRGSSPPVAMSVMMTWPSASTHVGAVEMVPVPVWSQTTVICVEAEPTSPT